MAVNLGIIVQIMVAVQAQRRGYSFLFWFVLSECGSPIGAIFALASLPDRALDQRRAREFALLEYQLAQAGLGNPTLPAPATLCSIGEASTLR